MLMSGTFILLGLGLLLLCLVPSLEAAFGIPDFLEWGSCSELKAPDLDEYKYSGIWFTQEMIPNEYTIVEQCAYTNYTWYESVMTVMEKGLSAEGNKLKKQTLMYPDGEEPNVFNIDSPGVPTAPYKIMSTDYTGYSCTYSCMEFMGFKAEFFWTFTRKPNGDPKHIKHCRDIFSSNYMDVDRLDKVRQGESCPYWNKVDTFNTFNQHIQDIAAKKSPATTPTSTSTSTATTTTTHRPRPPITSTPTAAPTAVVTSQRSTNNEAELQRLDDMHTIINKEEKLLVELEEEIHEEEKELLHLIEEEQDIREKNYRTSRKNIKHRHRSTSTEAPTIEAVTASAGDLSSSVFMAALPSLLVFLRATMI